MKRLMNRQFFIFVAIISFIIGFSSCKSQKKIAEEKARQELLEKTVNAKTTLKQLLAKTNTTLEEVEADQKKLDQIKAMNLADNEVVALIKKEEEKLATERKAIQAKIDKEKAEEEARLAEEERRRKVREQMESKENRDINYYLDNVLGAGNTTEANQLINDALKIFESPETVVLIEIYNDGTTVDYDKPTTAKKYLNYLKDVQRKPDKVKEFKKNDAGKITELVLTKIKY